MFFNKGYRQERRGENEKAKHEEPTSKRRNHQAREGRARLEVNSFQQTRIFVMRIPNSQFAQRDLILFLPSGRN